MSGRDEAPLGLQRAPDAYVRSGAALTGRTVVRSADKADGATPLSKRNPFGFDGDFLLEVDFSERYWASEAGITIPEGFRVSGATPTVRG